ncbi:Helicase associated domain protein [Streptomyces lividans]
MISLREHQVTQKTAIREWVKFFARSSAPGQGARGTLVSATGSGKTITAAVSALECFPGGRILVTVPTLDLLAQTAQAWRAVGHRAPMVAVCSLENDPVLSALGVRTTTNAIQLALWARTGPVVVFATYASLVDREDPEERQFANGIDAAGRRVHRAFLASCRVLGEGVDITGERGVEAICFAVAVLQGLRSHDERLVEQLASRALTSGKRKTHIQRDTDGRIIAADGGGGGEEQDDTGGAVESALLHFSTPRDPATIAAFLRTRIYRPESLVWLEGYQALLRWRAENEVTGLYAVPYDVETEVGVTKDFPLGRWIHQQRKALRTGELEERRKKLLDAPEAGMVWEPGEEAWENKLAALRSYRRVMGHLAPRQDAVWGEGEAMVPVGQHMANLRRKGGLGKNPERAAVRAQQLAAVDEDWNCPWPLDWQRHYRHLAHLSEGEPGGVLPDIAPGVQMDGDDIGRWLKRQRRDWKLLATEQQERLSRLGVQPVQAPSPAPAPRGAAKGPSKAQQAFQRGLTALAQWVEREGADRPVPRKAVEVLPDGTETKLGVWVSNTRGRRYKLTGEQLDALRELGVDWA